MEIFFFQMDNGSVWEKAFFGKLNTGVSEDEVRLPAAFFRLSLQSSIVLIETKRERDVKMRR